MRESLHLNARVGGYQLIDRLGEGGMGEVYRAVHLATGRVVAVKVLTRLEPRLVARFRNEARLQATIQHPHVAALIEFFEHEGRPCLAMEYVDGEVLDAWLRRRGPLPVREALAVVRALAEALDAIHAHGIIHRDIKTSNVKISATGQVKLLDFGIAKGQAMAGLTATHAVVGTPASLSPEQLKGHEADERSDLWALGVLFYELVTGYLPFEAEAPLELYAKIDRGRFTPPSVLNPAVGAEVEALIVRCLKKRPVDRHPSARALCDDLDGLLDASAQPPKRSWTARILPPRSPGRRMRRVASMAGAAVLVLGLVLFALLRPPTDGPLTNTVLPPASGASSAAPEPPAETDGAPLHTMTIDVMGEAAQVYRNDSLLGSTPYELRAPVGTRLELMLRREGYHEHKMNIDVMSTTPGYRERMNPIQ